MFSIKAFFFREVHLMICLRISCCCQFVPFLLVHAHRTQKIGQGFVLTDKDHNAVKDRLSGFELLDLDPLEAAYGAASLYRHMRKRGLTILKSNDCLIAFYAISFKAVVLHSDEDFDHIAQHTALKTMKKA